MKQIFVSLVFLLFCCYLFGQQQNEPPTVTITDPLNGSIVDGKQVKISYLVSASAPKSVKISVDEKPVQLLTEAKLGENTATVDIPEKNCIIAIVAQNEYGASEPATVNLIRSGNIFKPTLYVLAIGVSNYHQPVLQLQFPAKDAADFAQAMLRQAGLLYERVELKLLADRSATEITIRDGLNWLQRETTNRDVAMLFIAGHGINSPTGDFYFMPVNADIEKMNVTCVSYTEIKKTISNVPGKLLVFMDACHSGNVLGDLSQRSKEINDAVSEIASAGNAPVVYTSSTGAQYSLESREWNNGAFTKALVEGLNGKADLNGNQTITVKSLDYYIAQRVKELTKGKQAPTTIIPQSVADYPIAVVTDNVATPSVNAGMPTVPGKGVSLTVDPIEPQKYSGSRIMPAVTVRDGAAKLIRGIDYEVSYGENINTGGTAGKVMITGVGGYAGSAGNGAFAITPKEIALTVDPIAVQTYSGSQIMPELSVRDGKTLLKQGADYTVEYGANMNPGNHAGSVAITGMGNYMGCEGKAVFAIAPKTLTIESIMPQTYTGKRITPDITVKVGETTLTAGTDYSVNYGANIDVTGNVVVTGAGAYTFSTGSATFTIRRPREMVFAVNTGASAFGDLSFTKINGGYASILGAEAAWYLNRNIGLGMKVNVQTGGTNSVNAIYSERLTFVGPAFYLRLTNHKRLAFVASAGAGALNWKWNWKSENTALDESSASFGALFAAGVNYMATKHVGVSVNVQTLAGKVKCDGIERKPAGMGGTLGVNFRF
jgi:hypothetical protein